MKKVIIFIGLLVNVSFIVFMHMQFSKKIEKQNEEIEKLNKKYFRLKKEFIDLNSKNITDELNRENKEFYRQKKQEDDSELMYLLDRLEKEATQDRVNLGLRKVSDILDKYDNEKR